MKIVPYDTLVPDIAGIQPNSAWLLASFPQIIYDVPRDRVQAALEDLQLKFSKLQGKILELEANAVEFNEGSVTIALPEEIGDDLAYAEDALRTALAEVIVQRGEQELESRRKEKNDKIREIYGGLLKFDPTPIEWILTAEDVENWKAMYSTLVQGFDSGVSIQEAIRQSREKNAEVAALKAVVATVAAMGADDIPFMEMI